MRLRQFYHRLDVASRRLGIDRPERSADIVCPAQNHHRPAVPGASTSCRNRSSSCGVTCPLIPRFTYGLPGKNLPYRRPQKSVIESPKKTTRFSPDRGSQPTWHSHAAYRRKFATSLKDPRPGAAVCAAAPHIKANATITLAY